MRIAPATLLVESSSDSDVEALAGSPEADASDAAEPDPSVSPPAGGAPAAEALETFGPGVARRSGGDPAPPLADVFGETDSGSDSGGEPGRKSGRSSAV